MNEHQNKSLARTNFGIEILNNLTLQLYSNWLFEKLYLTYERVFHLLFYNLKSSCQTMFFIHSRFLFFWISDKTLLLMCDISLQSIGYQNKTLPLVFDVTPRCLAIRWNTHSHLWYIISWCLDIKWITPSRVRIYHYSVMWYQAKHSFSCLI